MMLQHQRDDEKGEQRRRHRCTINVLGPSARVVSNPLSTPHPLAQVSLCFIEIKVIRRSVRHLAAERVVSASRKPETPLSPRDMSETALRRCSPSLCSCTSHPLHFLPHNHHLPAHLICLIILALILPGGLLAMWQYGHFEQFLHDDGLP